MHVSSLASDYYHFDQVKQRLLGERSGVSFQLGDTVKVQVVRVSLDDKKIDLELVEGSSRAKRRAVKSGQGGDYAAKKPAAKKKKPRAKSPAKKADGKAGGKAKAPSASKGRKRKAK